jgi:hypothetical protein
LSLEDKVAIFRPVKPVKAEQPAPEANRFPRRRVIEVAPAREAPSRPRPGGNAFIPPGLPLAARRVRARESVQNAIAALPPDDQGNLLLEVLAELYERRGVRIPEPAPAPASARVPSEPQAAPPPSQRPIPVPVAPAVAAAAAAAEAREEAPASEPAPKRAAATRTRSTGTARATTKKRA